MHSPMPHPKKITKAVIPAAGFGTRMLPATKALPKEMLPVAGKPLIQYAIEEAAASGIETVVIVVRNHRSLIESHFAPDPALDAFLRNRRQYAEADELSRLSSLVRLEFVEQHQPRGLGDAIRSANLMSRIVADAIIEGQWLRSRKQAKSSAAEGGGG